MKKCVLALLVLVFSGQVLAQEEPSTLNEKYDELLRRSETYQVYKVITREGIDALWAEVKDSLTANNAETIRYQEMAMAANEEKEKAEEALQIKEQELSVALSSVGSVSFLGTEVPEGTYHVIVWSVVFILLAVAGWLGFMYKNSHAVTDKANKEYQTLQREYDNFRDASREKQVKIKRELQTALNDLEELKRIKR